MAEGTSEIYSKMELFKMIDVPKQRCASLFYLSETSNRSIALAGRKASYIEKKYIEKQGEKRNKSLLYQRSSLARRCDLYLQGSPWWPLATWASSWSQSSGSAGTAKRHNQASPRKRENICHFFQNFIERNVTWQAFWQASEHGALKSLMVWPLMEPTLTHSVEVENFLHQLLRYL